MGDISMGKADSPDDPLAYGDDTERPTPEEVARLQWRKRPYLLTHPDEDNNAIDRGDGWPPGEISTEVGWVKLPETAPKRAATTAATPIDEANAIVCDYLRTAPDLHKVSVRSVAEKTRLSKSMVWRTPAWRLFAKCRRELKRAGFRTPRQMTDALLAVLPDVAATDTAELDRRIAE
jgi:hypothetical protein